MVLKKHTKGLSLKNKGGSRRKITRFRRTQRHVNNRKKHTKRNKKINKGGRKKRSPWWTKPLTAAAAATTAAAANDYRYLASNALTNAAAAAAAYKYWAWDEEQQARASAKEEAAQEEGTPSDAVDLSEGIHSSVPWYDTLQSANQPDYSRQVCPAEIIEGEVLNEPIRSLERVPRVLSTISEGDQSSSSARAMKQALNPSAVRWPPSSGWPTPTTMENERKMMDEVRRARMTAAKNKHRERFTRRQAAENERKTHGNIQSLAGATGLAGLGAAAGYFAGRRGREEAITEALDEIGVRPECPICMQRYSEEKKAFILTCGHTFCEDCIRQEIRRNQVQGRCDAAGIEFGDLYSGDLRTEEREAHSGSEDRAVGLFMRLPCPTCNRITALSLKNYGFARGADGSRMVNLPQPIPLDELMVRNYAAETEGMQD